MDVSQVVLLLPLLVGGGKLDCQEERGDVEQPPEPGLKGGIVEHHTYKGGGKEGEVTLEHPVEHLSQMDTNSIQLSNKKFVCSQTFVSHFSSNDQHQWTCPCGSDNVNSGKPPIVRWPPLGFQLPVLCSLCSLTTAIYCVCYFARFTSYDM